MSSGFTLLLVFDLMVIIEVTLLDCTSTSVTARILSVLKHDRMVINRLSVNMSN